jgi:hypothetical protein
MPALFDTIVDQPAEAVLRRLRSDHDRLADATRGTARTLAELKLGSFGIEAKRRAVPLPGGGYHSLIELFTQLATVERLIDALAFTLKGREQVRVGRCNPTTTSIGHDLELDVDGEKWAMEVSDVAADRSNNGKFRKDLDRLLVGVADRRFLVVSSEWGQWLPTRTRAWTNRSAVIPSPDDVHFPVGRYRTAVIEVRRTAGPAAATRSPATTAS